MNIKKSIYDITGPEVALTDMLGCRERRVLMQHELLTRYHKPLISFSMNIAGPVKNSRLIKKGFELGMENLRLLLSAHHIDILYMTENKDAATGPEMIIVADAEAEKLKKLCCMIEDKDRLGRLFDMDVIACDGSKVSRTELGLPGRSCLICGGPAADCARSRAHSVPELQNKTAEILSEAADLYDCEKVSRTAARSLLYEVCATPKPGLVDRANTGSHEDMNIYTFIDSTVSLIPYLRDCFMIGRKSFNEAPSETFSHLRKRGITADQEMLIATHGVNTHKGAIFSIGIVCGALGRLPEKAWSDPSRILSECAAMTAGIVEQDFSGLTGETARTAGQRLYLNYGITGVRGQMEKGLPAVLSAGLPSLEGGISRGLSWDRAGAAALLAITTAMVDTNLVSRSDVKTEEEVRRSIRELLDKDPYPSIEELKRLDDDFIRRRLSPGGSADLLSVTYLLYFLSHGADNN